MPELTMAGILTGLKSRNREFTPEEIAENRARRKQKLQDEIRRGFVEHAKRVLENSGLKESIEKLTFDSFVATDEWQRDMKQVALSYAEHPDGWMLLSGQSGCGKTHLCTAAAGKLLKRGIPVRYMRWRMDTAKLKPNYDNPDSVNKELQRFINTPCLYVDDLFKGSVTDSDKKLAFALIDGRYSTDRKTIISTELTPNELLGIDEAIGGRILEKCKQHIFVAGRDKSKNYRIK